MPFCFLSSESKNAYMSTYSFTTCRQGSTKGGQQEIDNWWRGTPQTYFPGLTQISLEGVCFELVWWSLFWHLFCFFVSILCVTSQAYFADRVRVARHWLEGTQAHARTRTHAFVWICMHWNTLCGQRRDFSIPTHRVGEVWWAGRCGRHGG